MAVRRFIRAAALTTIVALALALRLWNIDFGLPDWYHPDEPLKARIVADMAAGDLDPQYFYHPSFILYAAALAHRAWRSAGGEADERSAAVAGRTVVALLGAATVPLIYLLGRRLGGPAAGLLAALLLTLAPLHVVCSHYLKEDVPLAFWAVAAFLACLRVAERGRKRDYLVAGFVAGLGAGTKYPGLLLVGLIWLAHREQRLVPRVATEAAPAGHLRLAIAASGLGFLLTTPYALVRLPTFLLGLGHAGGNFFTGMAGIAVSPLDHLWTFHLRHSIVPGLGAIATVLAVVQLGRAFRVRTATFHLLTAVVFTFYTVFEISPYKPPPNSDRHVVPLLPFLAVLTALLAVQARSFAARRLGRSGDLTVFGIALLIVAEPGLESVRLVRAMQDDTRAAARQWLLDHACGNKRILLEGGLNAGGVIVPSYVPQLPPRCEATYTYSLAREAGHLGRYDLLVASSFMYERFFRHAGAPAEVREFYRQVFETHERVTEFVPRGRSYGFHNPIIRIYRARERP